MTLGIIHNNIFPEVASLEANTADPLYPVTNLKDDAPAHVYKSTGATIQITASFATARTVQAFGIVNHNFPANSPTLNIQLSNSPTFQTYNQVNLTYHAEIIIKKIQTPQPYQYYRFNFTISQGDYSGQIGNIVMGTWLEIPNRIKRTISVSIQRVYDMIKGVSGQITKKLRSKVRKYSLSFFKVPEADFEAIDNALTGDDLAKVFVLNLENQSGYFGHDTMTNFDAEIDYGYHAFNLEFQQSPYFVK